MHDRRPPDVARCAIGRRRHHLDAVGDEEQSRQHQGRNHHRQQRGIAIVGAGDPRRGRPQHQRHQQSQDADHADPDQPRAQHAAPVPGPVGPADQHRRRRRQAHRDHEDDGRDVQDDGPGRGLDGPQPPGDEGHGGKRPDLDEIARTRAIADLALLAFGRTVAPGPAEDPQRPRLGQSHDVDDQEYRQRGAGEEGGPGRTDGAVEADPQQVRHQHQVQRQVDAVGDPHGPHPGLGPVQGLEEELRRHADQIAGHGQGEDDQHRRGPLAEPVGQPHVRQRPGTDQNQGDHGGEAQLQRIGHAPPQHRPDLVPPTLAEEAGGHHLHPHHQTDGSGDHDHGRGQGEGAVGQLHAREIAHHDDVGQPHGHDADPRQHHRPREMQQVFQGGAGLDVEADHGTGDRPR